MSLQSDEFRAGQAIKAGDYDQAVRLLRSLAERDSAYALVTLGWIYETGATGASDKQAARSFYEHASAQGDATACLYLGRFLWREGQEVEARKAFERGAQLHNEECRSELVRLTDWADEKAAERPMEEGNYEEAARLLRPLAERNSRFALRCLGFLCETGVTGAPDMEAARSYYELAASQGCAEDYHELGRFLTAVGDEVHARAAYEAAARLDYVPSMSELGRMMVEGFGGPADEAVGRVWLEKAAAQGHTFARRTLLALQESDARTLLQKLSVKIKIARLAFAGARVLARGGDSDQPRWLSSSVGPPS